MPPLADEATGLCASRGQTVQRDFLGAPWLFPEENCCACGKGVRSLDTRFWEDCDPRWPTPKRGCPGFSAWEQASAFYIGQSHQIRSQSQGNPCISVSLCVCLSVCLSVCIAHLVAETTTLLHFK